MYIYIPYFLYYKMHSPKKIWKENGGATYSLNVAYLACWVWGGGEAVFFPIFL